MVVLKSVVFVMLLGFSVAQQFFTSSGDGDSSQSEIGIRTKRQTAKCQGGGENGEGMQEIFRNPDNARDNSLITFFFMEEPNRKDILRAIKDNRDDAITVIDRWLNNLSTERNTPKDTEMKYGTMRLDRQNGVNTLNFGIFMNWQLQINGNKRKGEPTSVAKVVIPETLTGYDLAEWRKLFVDALRRSLDKGAPVWVVQQTVGRGKQPQCPIPGKPTVPPKKRG